jgi:hypothetical protein
MAAHFALLTVHLQLFNNNLKQYKIVGQQALMLKHTKKFTEMAFAASL